MQVIQQLIRAQTSAIFGARTAARP
jgi:hypothetical protein